MPNYPGSLPALVTNRVTGNAIPASDHNDTAAEVNAIGTELGTHPSGASATVTARLGLLAVKPSTADDAFDTQFQFVAEKDGNDSNDGLSWGTAKKEIQAAIAATPNGAVIVCAPGTYRPTATLVLNGHRVIALGGVNGGVATNAKTSITHNFNGDLIEIQRGGGIGGFVLVQMGNFTGAAIKAVSTTAARTGLIYLSDLVTSSNDGVNGFTRNLDLDGSADSTAGGPGLRSVFAHNIQFFGAKTAGENVRMNRVIHAFFTNFEIIQGPETGVQQGLKILHNESEEIYFHNAYILGDFDSEAGGTGQGCRFDGTITGAVHFRAGSSGNILTGHVPEPTTYAGAVTNLPGKWINATMQNSWVTFGAGYHDAAYRRYPDGTVKLRGTIKSGASGTVAFTLPTGYRPLAVHEQALTSNGLFGSVSILASTGTVTVTGSTTHLSLGGVEFQAA